MVCLLGLSVKRSVFLYFIREREYAGWYRLRPFSCTFYTCLVQTSRRDICPPNKRKESRVIFEVWWYEGTFLNVFFGNDGNLEIENLENPIRVTILRKKHPV